MGILPTEKSYDTVSTSVQRTLDELPDTFDET